MNKFKELLEKAGDLQFIKKAKDYIALHKIAAVTTATIFSNSRSKHLHQTVNLQLNKL